MAKKKKLYIKDLFGEIQKAFYGRKLRKDEYFDPFEGRIKRRKKR